VNCPSSPRTRRVRFRDVRLDSRAMTFPLIGSVTPPPSQVSISTRGAPVSRCGRDRLELAGKAYQRRLARAARAMSPGGRVPAR
jgi:hypothetical protein